MPGFTTITVSGQLDQPSKPGTPARGKVVFTLTAPLTNGTDVKEPVPQVARLRADGSFKIKLPAVNDPGTTPLNGLYLVEIRLRGVETPAEFYWLADAAFPAVDFSAIVPVTPLPNHSPFAVLAGDNRFTAANRFSGPVTFDQAPAVPDGAFDESKIVGLVEDLAGLATTAGDLAAEVARAEAAEATRASVAALAAETARATAAEDANAASVAAEIVRAEAAEATMATAAALAAETARAIAAEGTKATAAGLAAEVVRAETAEAANAANIVINTAAIATKLGTEDPRILDVPLVRSLTSLRRTLAHRAFSPVNDVAIGDSITEGYYAGSDGASMVGYGGTLLKSLNFFPNTGAGFVAARHVVAGLGTPFAFTAGVDQTDHGYGLGRRAVTIPVGESATGTFTGTSFLAVYSMDAGLGTISVTIDGGAPVTVATAGAKTSGQFLFLGAYAAGPHTFVVSAVGAPVVFDGIFVINGSANGVQVWNGGHAGMTAAAMAADTTWATGLSSIAPGLITLNLALNDYTAGQTPAQLQANLTTCWNAIKAVSPFASYMALIEWPPRGISDATWQPYADAQRAAARAAGAAVFDMWAVLGTPDGSAAWNDTVHPSNYGHFSLAEAFFRQVAGSEPIAAATAGGSLTSPVLITATAPTQTPLTLTGAAAQSVDYFTVKDSTGASKFAVNNLGVTLGLFTARATNTPFYSATLANWVGYEAASPNNFFQAGAAAHVPVMVRGAAAQTGDLQQWTDSSAVVLAKVLADGGHNVAYVTLTTNAAAGYYDNAATSVLLSKAVTNSRLISAAASNVVIEARGAASQTGDLQRWTNSSATVLAKVTAAGAFDATAVTVAGGAICVAANNLSELADKGAARANLLVAILNSAQCVATSNVALAGLQTIDGYTLLDGESVLCAAQTIGSQNGKWVAHSGAWVRPTDFATGLVLKGRLCEVNAGTVWTGSVWAMTPSGNITVDTTTQTWVSVGRQAGTNTTLTGNTFSVQAPVVLTSPAAGTVPFVVKAAASPSADITQWQDSTAAVLAKVTSTGGIDSPKLSQGGTALDDLLPWVIRIDPFLPATGNTNLATVAVSGLLVNNAWLTGSGAQNALVYWEVVLGKGTWSIDFIHFKAANAGIYTASIGPAGGASQVDKGTVDGYSAANSANQQASVNLGAVAATGLQRVQLKMATKNAASTNYFPLISAVQLRRTA